MGEQTTATTLAIGRLIADRHAKRTSEQRVVGNMAASKERLQQDIDQARRNVREADVK